MLPPAAAERSHYAERVRSRAWVDGLTTRGGVPRWHRITHCGRPVVVGRADGACSWEYHWCGDRACYACARSRSRKASVDLRSAVEAHEGGPLYFVTLTQRHGPTALTREAASRAWRSLQRAWERVRKTGPWRTHVIGGIKVVEVTSGRRVRGWHPHLHLLVELTDDRARVPCPTCDGTRRHAGKGCRSCGSRTHRSDGTVPAHARELVEAWCRVADALPQGQCVVPLIADNCGQLAKYMTKLWELQPATARELFAAAEGRRLIDGWGAWRGWRRAGNDVEHTPHGWFPSGLTVSQLEKLPHDAPVYFAAHVPGGTLHATPRLVRGAVTKQAPAAARLDLDALERSKHLARLPKKTFARDAASRDAKPHAFGSTSDVRGSWSPTLTVGMMRAGDVLARIRSDPRPVWERVDEKPPDHLERLQRVRDAIAEARRESCRGHTLTRFGCGPPRAVVD